MLGINYTLVSAVALCALGLLWAKTEWHNAAIKLTLFGLGVWGLLERFVFTR